MEHGIKLDFDTESASKSVGWTYPYKSCSLDWWYENKDRVRPQLTWLYSGMDFASIYIILNQEWLHYTSVSSAPGFGLQIMTRILQCESACSSFKAAQLQQIRHAVVLKCFVFRCGVERRFAKNMQYGKTAISRCCMESCRCQVWISTDHVAYPWMRTLVIGQICWVSVDSCLAQMYFANCCYASGNLVTAMQSESDGNPSHA